MRKHYWIEVWVGIFVILAGLGLAFLALSVSGLSLSGLGAHYYTVQEDFSSVDNLKVRSPVRIAGVEIGQVTGVSLDPKTLDAVVSMRIEDQFNQIPLDSMGQVASASLLGDNYIAITPGLAPQYLKNGSVLQTSNQGAGGLMGALSSILGGGAGLNPNSLGANYFSLSEAFPNVGDLSVGAPVKISGVSVGQVTQITLDPLSFNALVTFSILKKYGDLPVDSIGQVASMSLLGGNYLNLTPGVMPMNVTPGMELPKQGIAPTDLSTLISTFMSSSKENSPESSK